MSEKQAQAQVTIDEVPDLEAQMDLLSKAIDDLDLRSRQLAEEAGTPDPGGKREVPACVPFLLMRSYCNLFVI